MADEEKNNNEETPEETPEQAEEQAPEAEAEAPAETPEGAQEDAPAGDEPAPAEAPADGAGEPEGGADAGPDEMEGLDWKARRRLERSRRPAESRPQQSPEDRAKARSEHRTTAAKRRSSYRRKQREKHEAGQGTPPAEARSAGRKVRQGRVVSNKAAKTITVRIDVARRHPTYEKIVRQSNTLHAHDEQNEANEGDLVRIVETRPLSRTKRWRLVEVLEKAE